MGTTPRIGGTARPCTSARKGLEEGYSAERDLNLVEESFGLDEEAWERADPTRADTERPS